MPGGNRTRSAAIRGGSLSGCGLEVSRRDFPSSATLPFRHRHGRHGTWGCPATQSSPADNGKRPDSPGVGRAPWALVTRQRTIDHGGRSCPGSVRHFNIETGQPRKSSQSGGEAVAACVISPQGAMMEKPTPRRDAGGKAIGAKLVGKRGRPDRTRTRIGGFAWVPAGGRPQAYH